MILAYHRMPSSEVLNRILGAGVILPGIYRLSPSVIENLCVDSLAAEAGTPTGEALRELALEAVAYFERAQAAYPGPKTSETALKCLDILSGDAGRIFLSPGHWSEAQRGLGWPLTGVAFDAEALISEGARVRLMDFLPSYHGAVWRVKENPEAQSVEQAKEMLIEEIANIHAKELSGGQAIQALELFRLKPGEEALKPYERRKYEWPSQLEIIWDGPLTLDHVVEVWERDRLERR